LEHFLGHLDTVCEWQEQRGIVTLKRDKSDTVTALVGIAQERKHGVFGSAHAFVGGH
jgi:hypothetical protein